MHDVVIRGGTIIDGTGAGGYVGDVAIDRERIASVGGTAGRGRREFDAVGHWTRDRTRGGRFPIEWAVRKLTGETAEFFGFNDRGRLAPGLKADVNVIDYERLCICRPDVVFDLPAGGRRMVQRAEGYVATLKSGVAVFEHGDPTGALPGKLVRAGSAAR